MNQNIPFCGLIAYNTREYSYDNKITQLVRHTIEYIKRSFLGKNILQSKETDDNIRQIINSTPTYSIWDRHKVLISNSKRLNHPYFTKYCILQQLCIRILRHEEIKYGNDKDKVYGILFDGSWLWEEYLNTILKKCNFIHPRNKAILKNEKQPIYLFEDNTYDRYPDFYKNKEMIIDAKYKHLGGKIERNDIHQIISYMHVLSANTAALAYPNCKSRSAYTAIGKLNGLGGNIGLLNLQIPDNCKTYFDFVSNIEIQENLFVEAVLNSVQSTVK